MANEKVILTPDEAVALLPDGEYVHNTTVGMIMIGVDYERANAIKALHEAYQIELGGPGLMRYGHPIVCWDSNTHFTAFSADMKKVDAFEASRSANA